jgi:hypothetical protein
MTVWIGFGRDTPATHGGPRLRMMVYLNGCLL